VVKKGVKRGGALGATFETSTIPFLAAARRGIFPRDLPLEGPLT
jgi:hypothetical protein